MSDRGRQISDGFIYMWNINYKTTNKTKQKQTHRHRKQAGGCQGGEDRGWVK